MISEREQNIKNRAHLIRQLHAEVMGPWTDFINHGTELKKLGQEEVWMLPKDYVSLRQLFFLRDSTGNCLEVLTSMEPPSQRYGVGVLYPTEGNPDLGAALMESFDDNSLKPEEIFGPDTAPETYRKEVEQLMERINLQGDEDDPAPDTGAGEMLSSANDYRPSAMGISFNAEVTDNSVLKVKVYGGRYQQIQVVPFQEEPSRQSEVDGPEQTPSTVMLSNAIDTPVAYDEESTPTGAEEEAPEKDNSALALKKDGKVAYWKHVPVQLEFHVPAKALLESAKAVDCAPYLAEIPQCVGGLKLELKVYRRKLSHSTVSGQDVYTVCLINRTRAHVESLEISCLFHAWFAVELQDGWVVPYPESNRALLNEEEQSIALIYRNQPIFASGHGCSADWGEPVADNPFIRRCPDGLQRIREIIATPFPCFELPNISPDIVLPDGKRLAASMKKLAGLVADDDGIQDLLEILDGYDNWIRLRENELYALNERYLPAAQRHLEVCKRCLCRMRKGLELLKIDEKAAQAFRLANEAIYIQQQRSGSTRKWQFDAVQQRLFLDKPAESFLRPDSEIGRWRPFQIAFILMNLCSSVNGHDEDRDTVDLIWFPTGGGKTEAYLGLSAYALLYRRLVNPMDSGTHVIMRYTLRLLTAQQFQRASGLACALEHIRCREVKKNDGFNLGSQPFSIGLWVGSANTPNKNSDAVVKLREMEKQDIPYAFVVQRCPWCGAEIGRVKVAAKSEAKRGSKGGRFKASQAKFMVQGMKQTNNEVIFACSDSCCEYRNGLPILVVDEQIYDRPPSIVIGTIDKFAAVAWEPKVRSIFGIDQDGVRRKSPPGLIIQDELHLITGPLGTVSAMYETVINELCTDRRAEKEVLPKIISSTATTCNYTEQIRALYARPKAVLFPPPGLNSADNFFSTHEKETIASGAEVPTPGRLHVGLMGSGYPSLQTTEVRTVSSLMNGVMYISEDYRDPWWTLLRFFNSIRELGTGLTLLLGDIPERMAVLRRRLTRWRKEAGKIIYDNSRFIRESGILELTSRIDNSEVPAAIEGLQRAYTVEKNRAYDCCLASSIIEVGVDISRLSLMTITGQPKTTAQYIQVSGRVGRHRDKPGLVVTLYNPSRPRDRSHFERFRSYHDRLYSMVEPASLTPFTVPALQKTLSGLIAGYLRQSKNNIGFEKTAENPKHAKRFADEVKQLIIHRCQEVSGCKPTADQINWIEYFFALFAEVRTEKWSLTDQMGENPALLRRAGSPCHPNWNRRDCWPTLSSMRTVDSECRALIINPPSNSIAPSSN